MPDLERLTDALCEKLFVEVEDDIIWINSFFCQLNICYFSFARNSNLNNTAAYTCSKFLFLKLLLLLLHLALHSLCLLH